MNSEYIRRCPTCGAENAHDVMRCACGALLAGVDLVRREAPTAVAPTGTAAAPIEGPRCPYDDCGQLNPPGSDTCFYCNRPLAAGAALTPAGETRSLLNLPAELGERYRILRPLPTAGAEAELLLVEPLAGGAQAVLKLYRHGILPRREVRERVERVDTRHRVHLLASGTSDGHAWEVMEFCRHGALRARLTGKPLPTRLLAEILRQLAEALAAVHAAGLLHRDLKPENVLVRSEDPLDLALTDFGIASVLDATQRFTGAARTLPYASPESVSGVIDAKADYWALGMLLLEAALGRHPFAGLSEAVILHHLITRSIDVSAVDDRNLRKLLRGLLLREPRQRWGGAEIARWLAGDASLAEPVERDPGSGFAEPYRIASEVCHTPEQLAVALARNWKAGAADMNNGQIFLWFRDVQKDQNVMRLLLEMQHEQNLHVDVRLLRLIVHLAPGIPPVWRGESIELRAVLSCANLALKGDADAAHWLDVLYQQHVLEIVAAAGNAESADLVNRWNRALDGFDAAWQERIALLKSKTPRDPREVVDFDALVFGRAGPQRPPLRALHPRLLAIAYDPAWSERLRKSLLAELARLRVHCPWLAEIGDPLTMDATSLLVLESLLPEARKAAEKQQQKTERLNREASAELQALKAETASLLARIRHTARNRPATEAVCEELRADLGRYYELLERVSRPGHSDAEWIALEASLQRFGQIATRLSLLIDRLEERRAESSGWLSRPAAAFLSFVFVALMIFRVPLAGYLALAGFAVGIVVWRTLPTRMLMRQIREAGSTGPSA